WIGSATLPARPRPGRAPRAGRPEGSAEARGRRQPPTRAQPGTSTAAGGRTHSPADVARCSEAVEAPAPRPPLWKQPLTLLMIALTLAGLVLLFTGPWILGVGL